jgi:cell division protein FtsL
MMKRWIPIWVIPALIIFSIGTVWIRLFIVRTTYKINEVNQALTQMRREKESLQLRVMALRSPKRLEMLALNLAFPSLELIRLFTSKTEIQKNER